MRGLTHRPRTSGRAVALGLLEQGLLDSTGAPAVEKPVADGGPRDAVNGALCQFQERGRLGARGGGILILLVAQEIRRRRSELRSRNANLIVPKDAVIVLRQLEEAPRSRFREKLPATTHFDEGRPCCMRGTKNLNTLYVFC